MGTDVEQASGEGKGVRFEVRDGDAWAINGPQAFWLGPREEACEAMTAFLAEGDFGE